MDCSDSLKSGNSTFILSIASHQDQQWRTEVITADAPNSIHITLSTPPLPNQPFVMIPSHFTKIPIRK